MIRRRQRRHSGCDRRLEIVLPHGVKLTVSKESRRDGLSMGAWVMRAIRAYLMRSQCGWCLTPTDGRGPIPKGVEVTTGICRECFDRERAKL